MPFKDKESERAYRRVYDLARYHKRRKEMIAYLGGKCAKCHRVRRLEIHHLDPSLKSFDPSDFYGIPWAKLTAELDKCELRCRKHHAVEHEARHRHNIEVQEPALSVRPM